MARDRPRENPGLAIHLDRGLHGRRMRVQAHRRIAEPARFFDDSLRQLPSELVAAKGWTHVEPLHLAASIDAETDADRYIPPAARRRSRAAACLSEERRRRANSRSLHRRIESRVRQRVRRGTRQTMCAPARSALQSMASTISHTNHHPRLSPLECRRSRSARARSHSPLPPRPGTSPRAPHPCRCRSGPAECSSGYFPSARREGPRSSLSR